MNNNLKKEIIKQIFSSLGINNKHHIISLNSNEFKIDKQLSFENEEETFNIFSSKTIVEGSEVKIMIANISDEVWEIALILQLDNFMPCGMRLSGDNEDAGRFAFLHDGKWIDAATLYQGKILVGVESLFEIYSFWEINEDYDSMYNILIEFLKVSEE